MVNRSFDAELRRMLGLHVPGLYDAETNEPVTYLTAISERLITLAMSGNMTALQYLMNRIDGAPGKAADPEQDSEGVEDSLTVLLREVAERRRKIIDLSAEERRIEPEETDA